MRLSEYSDIMTSEEVADYLKVSLPTVYKLIDSKELYARKVGKNYRIPKNKLQDYMFSHIER